MQIKGATRLELGLRDVLIWNENLCLDPDPEKAKEASKRAGVIGGACEELQRLRHALEWLTKAVKRHRRMVERNRSGSPTGIDPDMQLWSAANVRHPLN